MSEADYQIKVTKFWKREYVSVTFNVCNASCYNNSHNVCSTLTVSTLNYMQCSSFALLSCYCFHSPVNNWLSSSSDRPIRCLQHNNPRPVGRLPETAQRALCHYSSGSDWLRRAEQIRHSSNEPKGDCGQELLTTTGHVELCEKLSVEFSLIDFNSNSPSSN